MLELGASAGQLGTPFAVTEGSATSNSRGPGRHGPRGHRGLHRAHARPAAMRTPWLERTWKRPTHCSKAPAQGRARGRPGLPDPVRASRRQPRTASSASPAIWPRPCTGDVENGLFFRGAEPLPFGTAIRPVRELIDVHADRKDAARADLDRGRASRGALPQPYPARRTHGSCGAEDSSFGLASSAVPVPITFSPGPTHREASARRSSRRRYDNWPSTGWPWHHCPARLLRDWSPQTSRLARVEHVQPNEVPLLAKASMYRCVCSPYFACRSKRALRPSASVHQTRSSRLRPANELPLS